MPVNHFRVIPTMMVKSKPLSLLAGIVALILLVVCVNLANLTLARASARRHEVALRMALGATPWQAIRQLLVESVFLATLGALSGLLLALWGSRLLVGLLAKGVATSVLFDLRPAWHVCVFAATSAVLTGAFIDLVPAWTLSREHPTAISSMDQRTLGYRIGSLGKTLIIAQIAISLVLLQASGLFLRTLRSLRTFNPGQDATGSVDCVWRTYRKATPSLKAGPH